jgi:hypothetical protein
VFAYPTHRLKIRNKAEFPPDIQAFLRSLFLPSPHTPDDTHGPGRHKDKHGRPPASRSARDRAYTRSHSYPNELANAGSTPTYDLDRTDHGSSSSSLSPPVRHASTHFRRPRPHSHSDPKAAADDDELAYANHNPELPRALVISGLEHAGMPIQRAFVEVLAEKRVIIEGGDSKSQGGPYHDQDDSETLRGNDSQGKGTEGSRLHPGFNNSIGAGNVWNLPDGFIVIYVCAFDPREPPPIHKSLVRFFLLC